MVDALHPTIIMLRDTPSGGISKQGAGLKSSGLRALSKRYSPDEHAASGMVLRLSTRETMSLITSVGSEFQPLFRRTLLGSAIVSAWVSDEGGGALAGMEERTKMEKRICAAGSGQVMMTTSRRLTYETHTSSVRSEEHTSELQSR